MLDGMLNLPNDLFTGPANLLHGQSVNGNLIR